MASSATNATSLCVPSKLDGSIKIKPVQTSIHLLFGNVIPLAASIIAGPPKDLLVSTPTVLTLFVENAYLLLPKPKPALINIRPNGLESYLNLV
jgi:hypothetical protein